MDRLSPTWLTEQHVDFEYKKYLVLAYLQKVDKEFEQLKLYPRLAELNGHLKELRAFREKQQLLQQGFKKVLRGIDWQKLELQYQAVVEDDALMLELEKIMDFSLPQFKHRMETGRELYEQVEEQIEWFPVGIVPIYRQEGYLLIKPGPRAATEVQLYRQTIFTGPEASYRDCRLETVAIYPHNLFNTFEQIKKDLIRKFRSLPNPATFVALARAQFPLHETLMPVATRRLLRALA